MKFIKFPWPIAQSQNPHEFLGSWPWTSGRIQTMCSEVVEFIGHEKLGTVHGGSDVPRTGLIHLLLYFSGAQPLVVSGKCHG
jgi:hypothetical protein